MTRLLKIGGRILGGVVGVVVIGLGAAYFALQRDDIPYDVLQQRYANSASRFVDLPGGFHVHYRDQGNGLGPTLLLLHGFGSSLETWEPWVTRLGNRYRLVSVDWPGHGLTQAQQFDPSVRANVEFVAAFSAALHLSNVIVVGNSLGGAVAWNLALQHPQNIAGLVLVDASGWEWSTASAQPIWLFKIIGSSALRKIDKTAFVRETLLLAYFDKSQVTTDMVQRFVDLSRAPGHRDILDKMLVQTATGDDADVQATDAKLANIRIPTLIQWGANDQMVDPAGASKFDHAISKSTVITYPNTGHVPMEEAATRSAADLDSWIARTFPNLGFAATQ